MTSLIPFHPTSYTLPPSHPSSPGFVVQITLLSPTPTSSTNPSFGSKNNNTTIRSLMVWVGVGDGTGTGTGLEKAGSGNTGREKNAYEKALEGDDEDEDEDEDSKGEEDGFVDQEKSGRATLDPEQRQHIDTPEHPVPGRSRRENATESTFTSGQSLTRQANPESAKSSSDSDSTEEKDHLQITQQVSSALQTLQSQQQRLKYSSIEKSPSARSDGEKPSDNPAADHQVEMRSKVLDPAEAQKGMNLVSSPSRPTYSGSMRLGADWACAMPTRLSSSPISSTTLLNSSADLSPTASASPRAENIARRLAQKLNCQIYLSLDLPSSALSVIPGMGGMDGMDMMNDAMLGKMVMGLEKGLGELLSEVLGGV